MQSKNKRKRAVIIALSAITVAAAVAIPVGIVFGPSSSSGSSGASVLRLDRTDKDPVEIRWNEPKTAFVAPAAPVDAGVAAADYAAGTLLDTDYVPGTTEVGATGLTVRFAYRAAVGKTAVPLEVTYALVVRKAAAPPLLNEPTEERELTFGDELPPFDFNAAPVGAKHFAYKSASTLPSALTDQDGADVALTSVSTMPVDAFVTAAYAAALDVAHYDTNGVPDGVFRIRYKIVARSAGTVEPGAESNALQGGTAFTLPAAKAPAANYVLKDEVPTTKVTARPVEAVNAPAQDLAIDPALVDTYEIGTQFAVVYTYTPAANYAGKDYTYTFNYAIGTVPATQPSADELLLPAQKFQYGKYEGPLPPVAPVLGTGYDGEYTSARFSRQSPVPGTFSRAVETDLDWTEVGSYNAGGHFVVTFTYKAAFGYAGDTFTATQLFVIEKQTVTVPEDKALPADDFQYAADVTALLAPPADDTAAFALNGTRYYSITNGTTGDLTAADVSALPAGSTFTAEWTYELNDGNYAPASGTTTSYKVTIEYTVAANAVSYTGSSSYQGAFVKVGGSATDFTPSDLPEPEKATGLEFKSIAYEVTAAPADGSVALGALADLSQLGTYGAGTVITATILFKADANHVGNDVSLTKTLTVNPADATQPTSLVLDPVTVEYGKGGATAPSAPTGQGVGYTGTYTSATITTATATSPASGLGVAWANLKDYDVGTKFTVSYTYTAAANYEGDSFVLTQEYTVVKQKIAIPENVRHTVSSDAYKYGAELSTITAPTGDTEGRFEVTETKYFDSDSATAAEHTAEAVKALASGSSFYTRWKFAIKDPSRYTPLTGTDDFYYVWTPFTVGKASATYTGREIYDKVSRAYKTGLPSTTPSDLPEPSLNNGYAYKSVTYAVTTASTDGVTATGAIESLSGSATFRAGTIVTATYTFEPDADHTGADITVTGLLEVTKKAVTEPSAADRAGPNTDAAYGTEKAQPTTAKTFEGYLAATYGSAKVTTAGGRNSPLLDTAVTNWNDFKDYNTGAVVTVTYNLSADTDNYSGVSGSITYTETLTVVKAEATLPTDAERAAVLPVEKTYGTAVTAPTSGPSLGTGLTSTLTSAVVSKQSAITGANSPAVGTTVDWSLFASYNSGTEIDATFTYVPESVNYKSAATPFTFVQKYVITKTEGTKPTLIYAARSYVYMSTFVKPTPTNSNGTGYDNGTLSKAEFTRKGTREDANSPEIGTTFDWTLTNKYNAGAQITLTYTYKAIGNYQGDDATFTQVVTINKIQLTGRLSAETFVGSGAIFDYTRGTAAPVTAPSTGESTYANFANFTQDRFFVTLASYNQGTRTSYKNNPAMTAEEVAALAPQTRFVTVWNFELRTDNYIPASVITRGVIIGEFVVVAA